jgi:hypothetical protein
MKSKNRTILNISLLLLLFYFILFNFFFVAILFVKDVTKDDRSVDRFDTSSRKEKNSVRSYRGTISQSYHTKSQETRLIIIIINNYNNIIIFRIIL